MLCVFSSQYYELIQSGPHSIKPEHGNSFLLSIPAETAEKSLLDQTSSFARMLSPALILSFLSVAKSFDIQKKVTFHARPNFTRTLLAYYLTSTYSEASSNPSNSKQNKDTDTTHKKINHLQHRTVKKKRRQIKRIKKNTEKSTRNSIPGEGNLLASGRHRMSR